MSARNRWALQAALDCIEANRELLEEIVDQLIGISELGQRIIRTFDPYRILAMILYSVTRKIDHSVHEDCNGCSGWYCIFDVPPPGCLPNTSFCRLLGVDESDGITYATQYFCRDMAVLSAIPAAACTRLQKDHADRYPDKYVAFRTLMEVWSGERPIQLCWMVAGFQTTGSNLRKMP